LFSIGIIAAFAALSATQASAATAARFDARDVVDAMDYDCFVFIQPADPLPLVASAVPVTGIGPVDALFPHRQYAEAGCPATVDDGNAHGRSDARADLRAIGWRTSIEVTTPDADHVVGDNTVDVRASFDVASGGDLLIHLADIAADVKRCGPGIGCGYMGIDVFIHVESGDDAQDVFCAFTSPESLASALTLPNESCNASDGGPPRLTVAAGPVHVDMTIRSTADAIGQDGPILGGDPVASHARLDVTGRVDSFEAVTSGPPPASASASSQANVAPSTPLPAVAVGPTRVATLAAVVEPPSDRGKSSDSDAAAIAPAGESTERPLSTGSGRPRPYVFFVIVGAIAFVLWAPRRSRR
jgi:hypothetical protein